MLHYLFTNDMRRNEWPDILIESARLIRDNEVPDQSEDKSKNNYINTQQSYLCIHAGTKANEVCCNGDAEAVILNFINRFQFPNARTKESFETCAKDGMCVAPLRFVVQLLFALNLVDKNAAWISFEEIAKYVVCNTDVGMGNANNPYEIAKTIVSDRKSFIVPDPLPPSGTSLWKGVEWKHFSRQIVELFGLLQFAPFIKYEKLSRSAPGILRFVLPIDIEPQSAKMFFYILANHEMWTPPRTKDWQLIRTSYIEYMDAGISTFQNSQTADIDLSAGIDQLSVALKMFADKRKDSGTEGWQKEGWNVNGRVRAYFSSLTQAQILAFSESQFEELFIGPLDPVTNKHKDAEAMMWAGSTGSGWDNIKPGNHADLMKALTGMVTIQQDPGIAAIFLQPGTSHPKGFGPSVTSELLMKFHPDACFKHGRVTHEVLASLQLIDFPYKSNYSDSEYKQVCGVAAMLRDKMKSMKLPRQINADGTEDTSPPDYLTVNEFIWFVNEKFEDIKSEVVKMAMKPADYSKSTNPPAEKKPKVNLANAEDVVLLRLAAALRTKPFAILAGHSGTGKSRMVRKLAYMTCARGGYKALLEKDGKPLEKPGNFCMVQVKPNWHDSADLLGYYSELKSAFRTTDFVKFICKAYAYPDVPFFVCLDEMNLAPVEQYFAEYLSAIESRKIVDVETMDQSGAIKTEKGVVTDALLDKEIWKDADKLGCEFTQSQHWVDKYGLTIPRNLFVVGTVNMDETTNQFSRKVLDRAFTLEMTDADFDHFGEKDPEPSFADYAGDDFVKVLLNGKLQASELTPDHKLKSDQVVKLNALKPVLADTSFVVAYRFANEYALYEDSLATIIGKVDVEPAASGTSGAPAGTTPPTGGASSGTASPAAKPDAFDDVVLMKLLPRINGDDSLVLKIYTGKEDGKLDNAETQSLAGILGKKGASFDKMKEIVARGGSYLSFWP